MQKGREITRGKTKILYEAEGQPDLAVVQQMDAITAGDGARRNEIEGKGRIAAKTTARVFRLLNLCGVPTHYISGGEDDDNNEMPIGERGEICARGPQVMQGYWRRPDETALVMTKDGFFRTGDIGIMDAQGRVTIVDRKKDMISVSGFKVFPNEVEDVAMLQGSVLECAAVGVPDAHSGEAVKLFAVKKPGTMNADELRRFMHERLAGYKVPKYIEFRDELPKTNVGKILRRALRDGA